MADSVASYVVNHIDDILCISLGIILIFLGYYPF